MVGGPARKGPGYSRDGLGLMIINVSMAPPLGETAVLTCKARLPYLEGETQELWWTVDGKVAEQMGDQRFSVTSRCACSLLILTSILFILCPPSSFYLSPSFIIHTPLLPSHSFSFLLSLFPILHFFLISCLSSSSSLLSCCLFSDVCFIHSLISPA